MLAILAVALAALAPFALAAEGQGDNNAGKQPTMAELRNQIAALDAKLGTLATANAVNALATTVGTLSSTVSANHATIVGKFAPQMAVVMSVPYWWSGANGLFTDRTLPAGTYLFELQQPYGDNTICQSELSRRHLPGNNPRFRGSCPSVRLHPFGNTTRLEDGYGIYTYAAPTRFRLAHEWPAGLKFSEDTTLSATERASANSIASYSGAVRITKLK